MFNSSELINKIATMTSDLEQALETSFSSEKTHELCENLETLSELAQCFEANLDENQLKIHLTQTLSQRFERIRGRSMCYTQQPFNEVNQLCLEIAKALSPIPENSDEIYSLEDKQGPYFLLMPSLNSSRSVFDNIHNYHLHEFVLSDTQEVFIPVQECLDDAMVSDTHVYKNIASKDAENTYPLLTETEVKRLKSHSSAAFEYVNAIDELALEAKYGGGLGNNLRRLIPRLRAGGAKKAGEEFDAAEPANIGILEFSTYWNSLSLSQQNHLFTSYPGLKNLILRLLRPDDVNYRDVRYCVELIADGLETLVVKYKIARSDLNAIKKQCDLRKFILNHMFSLGAGYLMNPTNQKLPDNLAFIVKKYPSMLTRLFSKNQELIDVLLENQMVLTEKFNQAFLYAVKTKKDGLIHFLLLKALKFSFAEQKELVSKVDAKHEGKYGGVLSFVAHQHSEFIQSMLEACPDQIKSEFINQKDLRGITPFMWAASRKNNIKAISELCQAGADINAVDSFGNMALHYAVLKGNYDGVNLLLSKMTSIPLARNNNHQNVLDLAIKNNNPQLIQSVLIKSVSLSLLDQQELVSKVDAKHKNTSYGGIMSYVIHQHPEFIQSILDACPNQIKSEFTNQKDLLGVTPLMWAALKGNKLACHDLYNAGADVNAVATDGNTALHYALLGGHDHVAGLLLDKIKDHSLLIRNNNQKNILDLAFQKNQKMIEPLLLKAASLSFADQKELLRGVDGGRYTHVLAYAVCEHPHIVSTLLKESQLDHLSEKDEIVLAAAIRAHVILSQVNFNKYLDGLSQLSIMKKQTDYPQAFKVTHHLLKELKDAKIQLACSTDPQAVRVFKQTCINKMKNSLEILDTHQDAAHLIHKFLRAMNKLYTLVQLSIFGVHTLIAGLNKVLSTDDNHIHDVQKHGKNFQ